MTTARRTLIGAVVLWLAGCGADAVSAPREHDERRWGRLGHPLGTYLTVEGLRQTEGMVGSSTLLVEVVNGTRLDQPVEVWVDDVVLPTGQPTLMRGYESGRYIGTPPGVTRATGLQSQAAWQFQRYFVATSMESRNATGLD
jgi:hypothetical protein